MHHAQNTSISGTNTSYPRCKRNGVRVGFAGRSGTVISGVMSTRGKEVRGHG